MRFTATEYTNQFLLTFSPFSYHCLCLNEVVVVRLKTLFNITKDNIYFYDISLRLQNQTRCCRKRARRCHAQVCAYAHCIQHMKV